jgi:hypothetical protein
MILIEKVNNRGITLGYDCENNLCAKVCVDCLEFKPIEQFHKYSGKQSRRRDCVDCFNIKWQDIRKKHKSAHKKLLNNWRKDNPEKVKAQGKRRKRTDKSRETSRVYWSKNKDKKCAMDNNRRIQKGKSFYCKLRSKDTEIVYKTCVELNKSSLEKLVVDHIIPLINKNVCGLHCPENLQILPLKQNCSKRNKFDGTYENESWRKDL